MTIDRSPENEPSGARSGRLWEILLVSTRLGLTSFGGPIAHLGYFHNEYVERRRWLAPETYAEIVGLAQALPGPASSQVGMAIGLLRGGIGGAICAWLGFTLPSAILMLAFAYGVREAGDIGEASWLHGLKLAAVAIVAWAVWGMARTLAPDRVRATIAIAAAIAVASTGSALSQIGVIVAAGVAGWLLFRGEQTTDARVPEAFARLSRGTGLVALAGFFVLLFALPGAAAISDSHALELVDGFFRTGSLVFGGGHVVLPLLEREVVGPGWVNPDDFLAGYSAAQAVPGPLFTFSAYLGAMGRPEPNGALGGTIALVAIFLPSFLLIVGVLPLWSTLRSNASFGAALRGVNAAVVGLLLAVLYEPVITSSIKDGYDFSIAIAAFGLLAFWRFPPWLLVAACAGAAIVVGEIR